MVYREKNDMRRITVTRSDLPSIEAYTEYLKKIWETRWLTNNGEFAQLLESKLRYYLDVKYLTLVSNGTLAIQLAIKALDIKGEVITTPFTFAATTNAIIWEGLTPIFADIDKDTFNIDPYEVEKKITDKTSAILGVHVYGNPCQVEELQEIADKYNLKLIYDAAHSFGVEYKNQSVLNYGDVSTLSFHATKLFHTIEGGALVVKDEAMLERITLLRNHGIKSEQEVLLPGTNAKMNEFQASMGLCNLEKVRENIRIRRKIYEMYRQELDEFINIKFQKIIASSYNYSYMPICFENIKMRDYIYTELVKIGIIPRKYFYPLTVDFDYFKDKNLVKKCNLKISSDIADRVLCLPLYPGLEIEIVDEIIQLIKDIILDFQ